MSRQRTDAVSKGRANSARPLLCLLFALLAAAAFGVPVAQAEQLPELTLTETDPQSEQSAPAGSTTPLVIGRGENGVTSGIGRGAGTRLVGVSGKGSSIKVTLYADPSCTVPVAVGDLNEFEGAGIEVEVEPDSETTFHAIQSDASGLEEPSKCSKSSLTYYESSTAVTPPSEPPPAGGGTPGGTSAASGNVPAPPAPRLRTIPGHRSNDDTPLVAGDAPGAGTVRVFADSNCGGAPVAGGSAAAFGAGLEVQVTDNATTVFTAVSAADGKQSACSAPVTYVEDSIAPRTRITMGPGVKTRRHEAIFRFADTTEDPLGTSYFCKVDQQKWAQCGSPFKLRHLRPHSYVLRVKAIDSAGNAEANGTKRRFTVIPGS